jgi:hypothetical protein
MTRLVYWLLPLLLIACSPSQEDFIADLKQNAENGDAQAQYQVGLLYYNGHSVPQDLTQAVNWFTRSAQQNDGEAQFNLGILYQQGDGVPQSYVEAFYWYMLAVQNEVDFAPQALNDVTVHLSLEQQNAALNRVKDFNQAHQIDFKVKTELQPAPLPPHMSPEAAPAEATATEPRPAADAPPATPSPAATAAPESVPSETE